MPAELVLEDWTSHNVSDQLAKWFDSMYHRQPRHCSWPTKDCTSMRSHGEAVAAAAGGHSHHEDCNPGIRSFPMSLHSRSRKHAPGRAFAKHRENATSEKRSVKVSTKQLSPSSDLRVEIKNTFLLVTYNDEQTSRPTRSMSAPSLRGQGKEGSDSKPQGVPVSNALRENVTVAERSHKEATGNSEVNPREASESRIQCEVATLMIKHIPRGCNRKDVTDAIASVGFGGSYNYFHMPTWSFNGSAGYAFVGFPDPMIAQQFAEAMVGYRFQSGRKRVKAVEVVPARVQLPQK